MDPLKTIISKTTSKIIYIMFVKKKLIITIIV